MDSKKPEKPGTAKNPNPLRQALELGEQLWPIIKKGTRGHIDVVEEIRKARESRDR